MAFNGLDSGPDCGASRLDFTLNDTNCSLFDTSGLELERVEVKIGEEAAWEDVQFSIGTAHPMMGSESSVECGYFGFGEQTQGKRYPCLSNTLSVKMRYTSRITSTLPVFMSAIRTTPALKDCPSANNLGQSLVMYECDQSMPIPPYLFAIASGNVAFQVMGERRGRAPNRKSWVRSASSTKHYRLYFLMEAFVTPALLTGDKNLVDVVVHEITLGLATVSRFLSWVSVASDSILTSPPFPDMPTRATFGATKVAFNSEEHLQRPSYFDVSNAV
ncbi:hypothetical protein L210DRAFT_3504460 [Boletus edulis BED1]|uniref:Uncharacterized protein n=1 Tax=Boletus edulis BED1 TaxID=1328754 RepID=A0AAD4BT47_BOLED|nr:hypothetical protein L210DRAFT_3504460 [Boletus edulis BED1]